MFGQFWWWKSLTRNRKLRQPRQRRGNCIGGDGYRCEDLEPRVLLATDLGTLSAGRLYLSNQTIPGTLSGAGVRQYTFTVPDAHVDIYMSFNGLLELPLARLGLTLEGV